MINLCAPAIIYLVFSLTQIIIDTFKGLYNTAILKTIVMILITILLNALCDTGMGVISWIIVFIPFIFMTVIITLLLYIFGLDPASGKLNIPKKETKTGNLIFATNKNYPQIRKNNFMDITYSDTPLDEYNNQIINEYNNQIINE